MKRKGKTVKERLVAAAQRKIANREAKLRNLRQTYQDQVKAIEREIEEQREVLRLLGGAK